MKKTFLLAVLLVFLLGISTFAQQEDDIDLSNYPTMLRALLQELVGGDASADLESTILYAVATSGDPLYIAPLIDLSYFTRTPELAPVNRIIFEGLNQMTGQDFNQDWQLAFEWASANNIALPPRYDDYKGLLFGTLIDPRFERFFEDVQETAQVNLLEALWGGVTVDGIPSLVNARQVSPDEAYEEGQLFNTFCRQGNCDYPADDEYVFGVSINGDNRAYPLRILNWHEMFNDIIGHMPLYESPEGEQACSFRAPIEFSAVGRHGETWVMIRGRSPGCPPEGGWMPEPENLDWGELTWAAVRDQLPDLATENTSPLAGSVGIAGQVPGKPVMLAYCTLCGSGVLYDVTIPDLIVNGESLGETVLEFGSTGMLMRSNKLMYDRNTHTVWNAITGEPAFGPLATSGIALKWLPVVVTDWQSWLEEHPDTSVLSIQTGYSRNYTNGAAYRDYFGDPEFLMFPVWQQDESINQNKDIVFTLLLNETPKAYPLDLLVLEKVTNDTLAGTDVVIVTRQSATREFFEPGGATVRAYERGEYHFIPGLERNEIIDQNGSCGRSRKMHLLMRRETPYLACPVIWHSGLGGMGSTQKHSSMHQAYEAFLIHNSTGRCLRLRPVF